MTKTTGPSGTRALVAPELLPSLDAFPKFELNEAMLPVVRGGGGGRERMIQPPLSAEQQAVRCEQRFAPGANGAPDVRLLVYTPPTQRTAPRPAFLHRRVPRIWSRGRGFAASPGALALAPRGAR